MNYQVIRSFIGYVIFVLGFFLLAPFIVSIIYGETCGHSYLVLAAICIAGGFFITRKKPKNKLFFAKEGFVCVSLSWIIISLLGCLPFIITGEIPSFTDALFETISGFTTTGASILSDVEALSYCNLFWRSLTHWIGGMGIIVFVLAVIPLADGLNMHFMKAESPGPSVGKLVPRVKQTASILYGIYIALTILEIVLLLFAGMPAFDSVTTALATAGTGGFGIKNTSIGEYSHAIQNIITVFMILFGVNFSAYFIMIKKKTLNIFKMEEVRWYLGIILVVTVIITFNIRSMSTSYMDACQTSVFQVASIITTTGFSTVNFDLWPQLSKSLLIMIMMIGACAGSTGGGVKVSRVVILFKIVKNEINKFIHPRSVHSVKIDGKTIEKEVVHGVEVFFITYVLIYVVSIILICFDNFDFTTNFSAVAATLNNIGPGLELVGPAQNFGLFSNFSKYVLMFDMLAGRLELFPILVLLNVNLPDRKKF